MTRNRRSTRQPLPRTVRRALEAQGATQFVPDQYAVAAGADADIADTLGVLDGFAADRLELMREVTSTLNQIPRSHRLRSAELLAGYFARLAARHEDRPRNIALNNGWERMMTVLAMDTMTRRLRYAAPGTETAIRAEIVASQDAAARAFWAAGARLVAEVMPIEATQPQG